MILPSIIDAAERTPGAAAMYSELQKGYSAVFEEIFSEAVDKGKLRENADVPVLVAMLAGPLLYRRWFSRDVVSEDFAAQVIAQVFPSLIDK